MQRASTRIPRPGEHEFAGAPRGNHLVIDDVRRQAAERETAQLLPDDLVRGGKADQVGEALDGDRITVEDVMRDRLGHRHHLHRSATYCVAYAGVEHRQPAIDIFGIDHERWREAQRTLAGA